MPATLNDGALTLTLADPLAIDNVLGSSYDDTMIGNANNNTLIGGGGDDLIAGLGGNDLLEGAVTRTVYLDFNTYELPGQQSIPQPSAMRSRRRSRPTIPPSRMSSPRRSPVGGLHHDLFRRPGAGRPRGWNFVGDRLARSRHLGHDLAFGRGPGGRLARHRRSQRQ